MNISRTIASLGVVAAAFASGTPAAAAAVAPMIESVAIEGEPLVGAPLRAVAVTTGDPAPALSFTWLRCFPDRSALCEPVGDGGADYVPAASDVGSSLAVTLTAVNAAGSDFARSALTTPVRGPLYDIPDGLEARPFIIPFPIVRIRGSIAARGSVVTVMRVSAPRAARVEVRCAGGGCPFDRRVRRAGRVRALERFLPKGTRITVRVQRRGFIGKYARLRIRGGKSPARRDACVISRRPRPVQCPEV